MAAKTVAWGRLPAVEPPRGPVVRTAASAAVAGVLLAAFAPAAMAGRSDYVAGGAVHLRLAVSAAGRAGRSPIVGQYVRLLRRRVGIDLVSPRSLRELGADRGGSLAFSIGFADHARVERIVARSGPPSSSALPAHHTRIVVPLARAGSALSTALDRIVARAHRPWLRIVDGDAARRRSFFRKAPRAARRELSRLRRAGVSHLLYDDDPRGYVLFQPLGKRLLITVVEGTLAKARPPSTADPGGALHAKLAAIGFFRGEEAAYLDYDQMVRWGKLAQLLLIGAQLRAIDPARRARHWKQRRGRIAAYDRFSKVNRRAFGAFYARSARRGEKRVRISGWVLTPVGKRIFAKVDIAKLVREKNSELLGKTFAAHFPLSGPFSLDQRGLFRLVQHTGAIGQQLLTLFLWPQAIVWARKHGKSASKKATVPGASRSGVQVKLHGGRLELISPAR